MKPVEKALQHIETHLDAPLTLADIASVAGITTFHLSRVFLAATGSSVMHYVKGRRLSIAAKTLAGGAPDILQVALDAGYQSHEAFTRVFCNYFGMTPSALRNLGSIESLTIQEPITMSQETFVELARPRLERHPKFTVAGLSGRYTQETRNNMVELWEAFGPRMFDVADSIGDCAYSVFYNFSNEGDFDAMAAIEVTDTRQLPNDFSTLTIQEEKYLVFTHQGGVASFTNTVHTIWNQYFAEEDCQYTPLDAPQFHQLKDIDTQADTGLIEVWVPVET